MIHRTLGFVCVLLLGLPNTAFAIAYDWSGASGNWTDSANWTPNGVPGAGSGDTVTINAAVTGYPNESGPPTTTLILRNPRFAMRTVPMAWARSRVC